MDENDRIMNPCDAAHDCDTRDFCYHSRIHLRSDTCNTCSAHFSGCTVKECGKEAGGKLLSILNEIEEALDLLEVSNTDRRFPLKFSLMLRLRYKWMKEGAEAAGKTVPEFFSSEREEK